MQRGEYACYECNGGQKTSAKCPLRSGQTYNCETRVNSVFEPIKRGDVRKGSVEDEGRVADLETKQLAASSLGRYDEALITVREGVSIWTHYGYFSWFDALWPCVRYGSI